MYSIILIQETYTNKVVNFEFREYIRLFSVKKEIPVIFGNVSNKYWF